MAEFPKTAVMTKLRRRWPTRVLLAILIGLLLVKAFVLDLYTVPQTGMVPTIAPGGRLFGLKHPYRDPSQVRRGDVIIFSRELPDGQRYQFVWRVIGLPGDHVEITGDDVRVNGQTLSREKIRTQDALIIYREHNGDSVYEVAYPTAPSGATSPPDAAVIVPPGEFYTLGDNRHSAQDSRYDGTVAFSQIIARKL